jgi:hypothetical protein
MVDIDIIVRTTIYPAKLTQKFSQSVSSLMPGQRLQEIRVKDILADLRREER